MNILKNQKGVTTTTVIGFILILGIVGFTGWRVMEANKAIDNNKVVSNEPVVKNDTKSNSSTETPVPDGYDRYSDKDLNLTFDYPESWSKQIKVETLDVNKPIDMKFVGKIVYSPEKKYWVQSETNSYGVKGSKANVIEDYKKNELIVWRLGFGDAGYGQLLPTFFWNEKLIQITTPNTCPEASEDCMKASDEWQKQYDSVLKSIKEL